MHYVCIEDNRVTSILSYKPNTPPSVSVYEITDDELNDINKDTHHFDIASKTVIQNPTKYMDAKEVEKQNLVHKRFLSDTDWMVLRHVREKALGLETNMTEDKYIELEQQRNNAAKSIV